LNAALFCPPLAAGSLFLLCAISGQAATIPITSITDIVDGTTIGFEQLGATANAILPAFNMLAVPDVSITTATSVVTGNSSAAIADRALSGQGFMIETTGLPWVDIGLAGASNQLGVSRTLTLTAFNQAGAELGSITKMFSPSDNSIGAYNAAAVFLGLRSTTPIYSIQLTSDNPNVIWDNLRFTSIPEPSSRLLIGCGLGGILVLSFVVRSTTRSIR
jgi:hypothetical protein